MHLRIAFVLFLVAGFLGEVTAALAQMDYPTRHVRVLAASAPGGNPDILARHMSQRLSIKLGQPFVVENIPGTGGVLAATKIITANPDGYTLSVLDSGALAINVALTPELSYNPLRDFTPITALASVPTVLVVPSAVPVQSLRELVTLAKAKPGSMDYGSAGVGSVHHITMAVFTVQSGIQMRHVAYRGGTGLVDALLKGEVQAGWSGIPNVAEPIKRGLLRPLAVSTVERQAILPDVPTVAESGFGEFDIATMMGLQGPRGMAPNVVSLLQKSVSEVLREPEMLKRMESLGMVMSERGTESYIQFIKDDLDRYKSAIKVTGVKAQ